MVKRHKSFMIMVLLYAMNIVGDVQACMTTFVKDGIGKIAIFNELDRTFTCMRKNEKRRFGNQNNHAHFVVYVKQPKTKMEIWVPAYTCKQNSCGTNGNILLKLSDIENNAEVTHLFTIIKHKPYSSMVGDLPMIQKKGCQLCEDEIN